MNYVALGRVSTDAQGHNLSKDVQFQTIHAYAEDQLWTCVAEYFDSGVSGAQSGLESRVALRDALALLESGEAHILALYDVTRMGREGSVVEHIIKEVYKRGGRLAVATERRVFASALEAEELLYWNKAVSGFEYIQIKKRTQKGKIRAIELGSFIFKPLTGYKTVRDGKIVRLVVDKPTATAIEDAFQLLVEGNTKNDIAKQMHDRGFSWDTRNITKFVADVDLYAGGSKRYSVKLEGRNYPVTHDFPAFISKEFAQRVKKAGKVNYRPEFRPTPYLGIVECLCGARAGIARRYYNGKRTQLICNSNFRALYQKGKGREPEKAHKHSLSDIYITKAVLSYLEDIDYEETLAKLEYAVEAHKSGLSDFEDSLNEVEKKKDIILKKISATENLEFIGQELDRQLGKLQERETEIQQEYGKAKEFNEMLQGDYQRFKSVEFHNLVEDIKTGIEETDWQTVNDLLSDFGIKVLVDFNHHRPRDRIWVQRPF